ncbi:hypothetical protein STZ1_30945 [Bacillus subtilis]
MRTFKALEIKAADISGLEKNRMDAAASQSFIAVAVNISEGISSADMYIEHYQKGKLVETIGPVSADYSEGKSDTLQFVYFESIKMRYCMMWNCITRNGRLSAVCFTNRYACFFLLCVIHFKS